MIDIVNTNRSKYRVACYFTLETNQQQNVVHYTKLSGKFYARIIAPVQSTSNVIGSGFYVNSKYLTIETCDNIQEIVENFNGGINYKIKIPSLGKSYLISDTQVEYDNDNLELQNPKYAKKTITLALDEIRNDVN